MTHYLPEQKALILHIPKTGGTWVGEVLRTLHDQGHMEVISAHRKCWRQRPRKHTPYAHFDLDFLSEIDFTAAFVRDPCDFYLSTWKWFRRFRGRTHYDPVRPWFPLSRAQNVFRRRYNFTTFVQKMAKHQPCWLSRLYELYVGPEGSEYLDFIGRTETLADDLYEFLEYAGYDVPRIEPRRMNVSMNKTMSTNKAKIIVKKTEKECYRRFYGENENERYYKERMIKRAIKFVHGKDEDDLFHPRYDWLWRTGDRKWNTCRKKKHSRRDQTK